MTQKTLNRWHENYLTQEPTNNKNTISILIRDLSEKAPMSHRKWPLLFIGISIWHLCHLYVNLLSIHLLLRGLCGHWPPAAVCKSCHCNSIWFQVFLTKRVKIWQCMSVTSSATYESKMVEHFSKFVLLRVELLGQIFA